MNLMIGTIVILKPKQNQPKLDQNHGERQPLRLGRVPYILQRVKSINLSRYRPEQPDGEQPPQLGRLPYILQCVKSINFSRKRSEQPKKTHYAVPAEEPAAHQQEPKYESKENHHVTRIKSDTVAKATPAATVFKKSASEKVVADKGEEEEEVDQRRPATVRERTEASDGGDAAVDAKADVFIKMFRQQLNLPRLDTILRYKDKMLNREAAK